MPRSAPRLLLLLLLVGWNASYAQDTGLLLGLRYTEPTAEALPYYDGETDSLSRAAYGTLLITEADGAFTAWTQEDALLIPRADGFWRVGTKRSVYNHWVEDFVWAAPDGAPRTLSGIQPYNGEYCTGHRKQTILYAGSQYLSLDQRSAGYCEGAAHPWFFNTLAVVPLDSTTHTGLDISVVLGQDAYEILDAQTRAFLDDLEDDDERPLYIEETDPVNWGLRRQMGQWTVLGRLEAAEEARQNAYADLPLALDLPPPLVGPPLPAIALDRFQSFAPDAVDVFVAPDQDWLVILREDHLAIHPVTPEAIGEAATTLPVMPGAHAVLIQWATGARLRGWIKHFEQVARSEGS